MVVEKEYAVKNKNSTDILQQIYEDIDELIDLNKNKPICTIGIGIPGVVVNGIILKSNSLSGLKGLSIRDKLEEKYGVKVLVENDINLVTIGFCHENKSDNIRNIMMIYLSEGVGAGLVKKDGTVKNCVNLGWKKENPNDILQKLINIPVRTLNDANAAALGELWKGAGKGKRNAVMITLGTGVGGGVSNAGSYLIDCIKSQYCKYTLK